MFLTITFEGNKNLLYETSKSPLYTNYAPLYNFPRKIGVSHVCQQNAKICTAKCIILLRRIILYCCFLTRVYKYFAHLHQLKYLYYLYSKAIVQAMFCSELDAHALLLFILVQKYYSYTNGFVYFSLDGYILLFYIYVHWHRTRF